MFIQLLQTFPRATFRTAVQQSTRFQPTKHVARSLCDSWASCQNSRSHRVRPGKLFGMLSLPPPLPIARYCSTVTDEAVSRQSATDSVSDCQWQLHCHEANVVHYSASHLNVTSDATRNCHSCKLHSVKGHTLVFANSGAGVAGGGRILDLLVGVCIWVGVTSWLGNLVVTCDSMSSIPGGRTIGRLVLGWVTVWQIREGGNKCRSGWEKVVPRKYDNTSAWHKQADRNRTACSMEQFASSHARQQPVTERFEDRRWKLVSWQRPAPYGTRLTYLLTHNSWWLYAGRQNPKRVSICQVLQDVLIWQQIHGNVWMKLKCLDDVPTNGLRQKCCCCLKKCNSVIFEVLSGLTATISAASVLNFSGRPTNIDRETASVVGSTIITEQTMTE